MRITLSKILNKKNYYIYRRERGVYKRKEASNRNCLQEYLQTF